jgi:FtsH-binding integral membrane protein
VALFRAATGLGVVAALVALVALIWHEVLDLAFLLMLLGSVNWLHEPEDRHSRVAIVIAGALSFVVGICAAVLLRHAESGFSRDVACTAIGALAGSQVYAAVTRRRP